MFTFNCEYCGSIIDYSKDKNVCPQRLGCKGAPLACDVRGIATTTLVVCVVLNFDQIFAYNTI